MNVYDGQRIQNMLVLLGYEKTDSVNDADVIILNTCAVREKATNKVFSALGRIRDCKKENAIFGIVGCVARESGEDAFRRMPELNFVLGPQSYHKLPLILDNPDQKYLHTDLSGLEKFDKLPAMTSSKLIQYIPIQEGCNHCCSYCIVPFTRGPEISRSFMDIMNDVRLAAEQGTLEICFLGQNVNGYNFQDSNFNFRLSDLIKESAKISNIKRIRYTSSYPTEMTDDLIDLHGTESKLLPFLNLPIQSGSPAVLKAMNRSYSIQDYLAIIDKLRAKRPDVQISSDFIVGFPGETDKDFEMTCRLAKKLGYINSYSFKYSKRPHTSAALMQNQIPESIKKERLKILDEILNENMRTFNMSCIGKTFDCLLDEKNYRTPYMQQVVVNAGNLKSKLQKYPKIKITDGNKCSLRGIICEA